MFNEYPYTDYHELNTDWIIGKIKNVETAEANTKQYAEDADAAKVAAEDAKDIAVQAKDDAESARDTAQAVAANAGAIVSNTLEQVNLLQARVDNIIPDGTQTAGNTELLDLRVGADGTIFDSAGNAVRGQIDRLNKALAPYYGKTTASYTTDAGYYYNTTGTLLPLTGFTAVTIDVSDLMEVEIYGYQAPVMSGIFFVDADDNAMPDKQGETYHVPGDSGYNTIRLEVPYGAVGAKTSFSTSGGRTYTVSGYKFVLDDTDLISTADVTMIPIFGQSLSVGAASIPPISTSTKYADGIMFNGGVIAAQKSVAYFTDFIPLEEISKETPASGCCEKITELIQKDAGLSVFSAYWNDHKILFVSCGAGSKTIDDLTTDYYAGLENAIQGAKNICDAAGLSLNIPCWIWIQGETDQKEDPGQGKTATTLAYYKSALTTLQSNLNTYVRSVTGQTNDIKCVCYQSGAQNIVADSKTPSYTNTAVMDVPTAQMQLVRDNSAFIASTPVYVLDHSTDEPIHLSAIGSKMLGMYCGIGAKAAMFGESSPTGLVPASYEITGTVVKLKYNVPVPPMRIDTTWVKEAPHYGFYLFNSSNVDIITDVSVFDDEVTITCSSAPLNGMLFYGFNGTAYRDGRIEGSRGNICDSAKYTIDGDIAGKKYTLGNYAYSFVKHLTSSSGTI